MIISIITKKEFREAHSILLRIYHHVSVFIFIVFYIHYYQPHEGQYFIFFPCSVPRALWLCQHIFAVGSVSVWWISGGSRENMDCPRHST